MINSKGKEAIKFYSKDKEVSRIYSHDKIAWEKTAKLISSLEPGQLVYTMKNAQKEVFLVLAHNHADFPELTCLIRKDIVMLGAFNARDDRSGYSSRVLT